MRVAIAAVVIALFASAPAAANPEVTPGNNAFDASAETTPAPSTSSAGTAVSAAGISAVDTISEPVCVRGSGGATGAYYGCGEVQSCGENGELNLVTVTYSDGSVERSIVCYEQGDEPAAAVLTPGRILEAFRRIPVPESPIGVNPVGGRTLVNFDTILHTEAEPFTETVRLLGRSVTFDIEPAEFTWSTGQGDGFTTTDPGQPYRESLPMSAYVTHRYLKAGDVQLGLQTTWTARWRVGNGPWRPVDGVVTVDSAPVPLEVVTARPQLVSYD